MDAVGVLEKGHGRFRGFEAQGGSGVGLGGDFAGSDMSEFGEGLEGAEEIIDGTGLSRVVNGRGQTPLGAGAFGADSQMVSAGDFDSVDGIRGKIWEKEGFFAGRLGGACAVAFDQEKVGAEPESQGEEEPCCFRIHGMVINCGV